MGSATRKSKLIFSARPALAARAAIVLITIYQWGISPVLGAWGVRCRFYPSCSQYAIDALRAYGFWRGCFRAIKRLLKCHPLHPGGYDPA